MSKSLPPILSIAIGAACFACEPVSTPLVLITPVDDEQPTNVRPRVDAGTKRDGTVDTDDDGGPEFPELLDPEECFVVRDLPRLGSTDLEAAHRIVVSRSTADLQCPVSDAGAMDVATLFSRRDGLPLFEAGEQYSWRWDLTALVRNLNLTGGESKCSRDTIYKRDYGWQLADNTVMPSSCHSFTAQRDAHYMTLKFLDMVDLGQVLQDKLQFKLCHSPCPPGTAHTFPDEADGGMAMDLDASASTSKPLVIPGITNAQGGLSIPGLTDDAGKLIIGAPP